MKYMNTLKISMYVYYMQRKYVHVIVETSNRLGHYGTKSTYIYRNLLAGENWRIWRILSDSPKFSSPIFTDTPKMHLTYALIVAYSPNLSSPIALTCMVPQNFPCQHFPVCGTYIDMLYTKLVTVCIIVCQTYECTVFIQGHTR